MLYSFDYYSSGCLLIIFRFFEQHLLQMISFFQFFSTKLRLSNPWRYKVPLLIAFTYFLLIVSSADTKTATLSFLAAIITTVGFMGFGYLTNDLSDRKPDALAGKSNGTHGLSKFGVTTLVILFLTMAISPWFYLPIDQVSIYFIIAELLLFILYAFPPFRLKEKGFLGIICDALYAHVIPAFLASWTFFLVGDKQYRNFVVFAIVLFFWQLFSGIRNILSHQHKDFENDFSSGTRTFAVCIGKEFMHKLMVKVFIPLEVVSFVAFLCLVQIEFELLIFIVIGFIIKASLIFYGDKECSEETKVKRFTNVFLDQFYFHWFPYIMLLVLAFGMNNLWGILIIHFLLFNLRIGKGLKSLLNKSTKKEGLAINSGKRLAIISVNRSQYSETFIKAHFDYFSNAIIYSDGYFPTSISTDQGETWHSLPKGNNKEELLVQSWKENEITVVLAEYGPSGVEIMNACEKAKIPFVVHFHGFDAYRNDVLNHYQKDYKTMFQKASKIIVVSKDMCGQLIKLGCPSDKIIQITYGVDTDLFSPINSNEEKHGFIACGRFVAKKAPLITIKAFAKVVSVYPDAKLTFIGEGELLNDAKALTKELNLHGNVIFKGVLTPKEVSQELRKHAIFVQHSTRTTDNDSEGTPLSILEAASAGLAIVSTNHGGIPDLIENGVSGFLVEEGDIAEMSEKMLLLYASSKLQDEFGFNARELMTKNYKQHDKIEELKNCINNAHLPTIKESKWTIWKYRVAIFIALFLLLELCLRIVGLKPGVIDDFYFHQGKVVFNPVLYGDEKGISHFESDATVIINGVINSQGFMSEVDFTKESVDSIRNTGKKTIMLIGDSYTQGCCADAFKNTFANLLNKSTDYEILNFGIPGADPLQYRLIVEKYAELLQPDLILVAVYGGNDIMEYNRTAKPFIPLAYPVKNGPWLNSEGPIYLTVQGTYFKNFKAAKHHYFDYFSLWSDQSNFFERTIRYSVVFSRLYLKYKTHMRFKEIEYQMPSNLDHQIYSRLHLEGIKSLADSLKTPVLFTLIPSPDDIMKNTDLRKKYNFVFGDLIYDVPRKIFIEDYDGFSDANHFNNDGHQKYAQFLKELIDAKL